MKARSIMMLVLGTILVLPCISHAQSLGDWQFGTLPANGEIEGTPGSKIGWGYTLTNQSSTHWLFATSISANNPFVHGTATANPFDNPVIAPGMSVTVPYDGTNGLADLTWDSDAPAGFTNSGDFTMEAAWYDADPFDGGNFVGGAGVRITSYRATVVPAPSSLALFGLGMGGLVFLRRRQQN